MRYVLDSIGADNSLLTRINAETDGTAFGHLEPTRASSSAVPESRLPEPSTPMDDLWSVKAAADMVRFHQRAQLTVG